MWRKGFYRARDASEIDSQVEDFRSLLKYITNLANHKLGYPVSLLTYLGVVDNKVLGIERKSLANILLNNVGDPFKDSETSLMEVKKHEREIIFSLERYYGLEKGEARGYVTTGGTEGNFAGLWWSKRYLINRGIDALITHDDFIKQETQKEQALVAQLAKIPLNDYQVRAEHLEKMLDVKNLIANYRAKVQELLTPTVFYSKNHTHYSIPKIAEILRLNIRAVQANEDGSINLQQFQKELLLNLGAHPLSPIIFIGNIGTTITGAIDDIPGIKQILDKIQPKVNYTIHLDGALTGFVLPIIKPFGDIHNYFVELGVNSLAVSAHKYPGLSQPCGILLAQRKFFDKAFEKSERNIDYVGNIVDVTITGSRSGLNVLMFYNAIHALGLDKNEDKLTKMVDNNLKNARYLYEQLVSLFGRDKVKYPYHFNVIFPRPSSMLAKKYQLMLTGENATICVLTNVNKALIDRFIKDLKADKERVMTAKDYTIETLNEEHIKTVVDLFTKSFCDSEPITKHLNIQYIDYMPFAREVVLKAVKDGMSKVAVETATRKAIAVCLAEDIADPFIPKLTHYPKMKPVFALLEQLSKPFMRDKSFSKGKVAHIWIAAVDPDFRQQNISTHVDMATAEMLARKGYDFAYAEFTNSVSERVVNQYSLFERINKILFSDFKLENGQQPFRGLPGGAASYIVVIRPGIKLSALENYYRVEEKY